MQENNLQYFEQTIMPIERLENNEKATHPITKGLREVLKVSGNHDVYIRQNLAVQFIEDNQAWVLTQYEINVLNKLEVSLEITVETSVISVNRFFVVRRFVLRQNQQDAVIIYAQFVVLDMTERKLAPMPAKKMKEANIVVTDNVPKINWRMDPINIGSLKLHATMTLDETLIDENLHVNNLVYLNWCLTHETFRQNKRVKRIQVKFGHELLQHHQVAIMEQRQSNPDVSYFEIMNATQNELSCTVKIEWVNEYDESDEHDR